MNLLKDKIFIVVVIISMTIFILLTLFFAPITLIEAVKDSGKIVEQAKTISIAISWLYLSLVYIIFSLRWWSTTKIVLDDEGIESEVRTSGYINADEIGVRLFFGKPIDVIPSGLPFVPLFFFELCKLPGIVQQKVFPGEPRDIYQGELKDPTEKVTFRNSISEQEMKDFLRDELEIVDNKATFFYQVPSDGLSERVSAEISTIIRWKIGEGIAIKFIENIGSVSEANRQIGDEMFTVLRRVLPKMSFSQANQNFEWLNVVLLDAVIKKTRNWGIEIESASIKAINLHHTLNDAIANATIAGFNASGIATQGAARAKAEGDLAREQIVGLVAGLVKMATDLGITGEVALANFVAIELARGGNSIIVGEAGLGQLIAAAKAIQKR